MELRVEFRVESPVSIALIYAGGGCKYKKRGLVEALTTVPLTASIEAVETVRCRRDRRRKDVNIFPVPVEAGVCPFVA